MAQLGCPGRAPHSNSIRRINRLAGKNRTRHLSEASTRFTCSGSKPRSCQVQICKPEFLSPHQKKRGGGVWDAGGLGMNFQRFCFTAALVLYLGRSLVGRTQERKVNKPTRLLWGSEGIISRLNSQPRHARCGVQNHTK